MTFRYSAIFRLFFASALSMTNLFSVKLEACHEVWVCIRVWVVVCWKVEAYSCTCLSWNPVMFRPNKVVGCGKKADVYSLIQLLACQSLHKTSANTSNSSRPTISVLPRDTYGRRRHLPSLYPDHRHSFRVPHSSKRLCPDLDSDSHLFARKSRPRC